MGHHQGHELLPADFLRGPHQVEDRMADPRKAAEVILRCTSQAERDPVSCVDDVNVVSNGRSVRLTRRRRRSGLLPFQWLDALGTGSRNVQPALDRCPGAAWRRILRNQDGDPGSFPTDARRSIRQMDKAIRKGLKMPGEVNNTTLPTCRMSEHQRRPALTSMPSTSSALSFTPRGTAPDGCAPATTPRRAQRIRHLFLKSLASFTTEPFKGISPRLPSDSTTSRQSCSHASFVRPYEPQPGRGDSTMSSRRGSPHRTILRI
eukprot:scaffold923_cov256-Pinguiococcus_pyrenoidosus.AAC.53